MVLHTKDKVQISNSKNKIIYKSEYSDQPSVQFFLMYKIRFSQLSERSEFSINFAKIRSNPMQVKYSLQKNEEGQTDLLQI